MDNNQKRIRLALQTHKVAFEVFGVHALAVLTWLMGAINLISAIRPTLIDRIKLIENAIPLEVRIGSRLTTALVGFSLFLLASSLWRRKRSGWLMTLLLMAISFATHLVKGLDYEESALALLLIVCLLLLRKSFYRHSDPPSVRQGIIVFISAVIFTFAYGIIGFLVIGYHTHHPIGLATAFHQTTSLIIATFDTTLSSGYGFYRYFPVSVYVIGVATIGFSLYMLIRPVLVRAPSTAIEKEKATQIVKEHGNSTSSFLALFDDKHYFFSKGGSVVAFAVRGRGALALGDPIGPEEDCGSAVAEFAEYCRNNDWQPSFLYIPPEHLPYYQKNGFTCLCVAHEAIIPLSQFTLEGSENKPIRNPYNKLLKMGYRAEIHQPPLDQDLLVRLRKVSDAWLSNQYGGEKYFIVGSFQDQYISNNPVIAIYDPDGEIIAFANIIRIFQKSEVTIDLMRHQQNLENGAMEFLFASLCQWAKEQGFESFSMGAITVFGQKNDTDNSFAARALFFIAALVNKFYRFQGLYAFKNKFHPAWEPRYVAFPGTFALPITVATLIQVHSGRNFQWWYLRQDKS